MTRFDIDINNDELLETMWEHKKKKFIDHHSCCAITWSPSFLYSLNIELREEDMSTTLGRRCEHRHEMGTWFLTTM
jgi:hypothetical protein